MGERAGVRFVNENAAKNRFDPRETPIIIDHEGNTEFHDMARQYAAERSHRIPDEHHATVGFIVWLHERGYDTVNVYMVCDEIFGDDSDHGTIEVVV